LEKGKKRTDGGFYFLDIKDKQGRPGRAFQAERFVKILYYLCLTPWTPDPLDPSFPWSVEASMPENITFRTHLLGSVTDFTASCDMKPWVEPQLLVELVVSLARYREEGKKLSPQIYLCERLSQILKRLPDSDSVKIGECPLAEEAVGEILKKCAPIAGGGWCVFVEGSAGGLIFGLFRGSLNPLAIPIDKTLFSGDPGDMKVVRLHQTADDCIELMNHCGERHNIFLSHRKEDSPHPKKYSRRGTLLKNITL
jgi:hypothetical protein